MAAGKLLLERVEAYMPSRGVARGFALFGKRIEQRQQSPVAVAGDFEANGVRAPQKLQQRWRFAGEHFAVEVAEFGHEAQRPAHGPLADDLLREPRLEVCRFGERTPDLVRRVLQSPRKAQPPTVVARRFESAIYISYLVCH